MQRAAKSSDSPELDRDYFAQLLQEKLELAASLTRLVDQSSGAARRTWESELEEVTRQIAALTSYLK
jgi:hypothetical protein